MNDEASRGPQRAPRKNSWFFTAVRCGYFLQGGWAAYKIVPICATFFAGLGIGISSGSFLFLIVAGVAILVTLALAKQVGYFNERYRRPVNLVLLIAAIGFAPMLLAVSALMLSGAFQLFGKLAQ
jgi:hypothetical protein